MQLAAPESKHISNKNDSAFLRAHAVFEQQLVVYSI